MRLIDADNLLKIFDERLKVYEGENGTKERYAYMAWLRSYHAIKDAPTIDAVEVVRCRNCIYSRDTGDYQDSYFCGNRTHAQDFLVHSLDYCSYGERSEE